MKRTIVLLLVGISLGLALPTAASSKGTQKIYEVQPTAIFSNNADLSREPSLIESQQLTAFEATLNRAPDLAMPQDTIELIEDEASPVTFGFKMKTGNRMAVMLTPPAYPFELTQACYVPIGWVDDPDNWDQACYLVFFDDGAEPGAELGRKEVSAVEVMAFNWFDVSDLDITIESGSFYFAVENEVDDNPGLALDGQDPEHHVSWMYTTFVDETEPRWLPFDDIDVGFPGGMLLGDSVDLMLRVKGVVSGQAPPDADFTADPRSGPAPLTVSFTDLSTGDPTEWEWDFGDTRTSTTRNPTHVYDSEGTYTVSLTVRNADGEDTEVKTNYITVTSGPLPAADFTADRRSGTAPLDVAFTDLSTENPTSWSWNFGDGGTSTSQNPTHRYNNVGTYTVSLTATNAYGSDTETKPGYITVISAPQPPDADFSADPTIGSAPLDVTFTDLSTNAPTSWSWSFGDGGSSTDQNPQHTYNAPGTYTVRLTATNADGSDTETKANYITVTEALQASFTANPSMGYVPLTHRMEVTFTDQSVGNPTSWTWDFGDNGTSTEQNPTHVYTSAGEFTVTLTVSNTTGADSTSDTVCLFVLPGEFFTQAASFATLARSKIEIRYGTPVSTSIELSIYNVNGQLVRRLLSEEVPAGEYETLWDLCDDEGLLVGPGVYFLRLKAPEGHAASKIIITR
ncbi:MAG: PKD domain-containing protein [Candidatus Stahlbacteria bacterium]|nr:MAG: PKD domain-containing protein [Candidatus Stahlbacteria bacterium]